MSPHNLIALSNTSGVSQTPPNLREWSPPQYQTAASVTFLWNIAGFGLVLNGALLSRYLKTNRSLPFPISVAIVINMCLTDLLLVLGVLLAALTLSLGLDEGAVKAGRVQLFLAVSTLLQSWLNHTMAILCSVWTRVQQIQARTNTSEIQPSIISRAGKWRREYKTNGRFTSRQRLYKPYRRHTHLTQTATERTNSMGLPATRLREAFETYSSSVNDAMTGTVKWWLAWTWLLSFLAAAAFLMTTENGRDVCKTLDPFQTQYSIAGDGISQVRVSENSLSKLPLVLVLVPVYVLGICSIIWALSKNVNCRLHLNFWKHSSSTTGGDTREKRMKNVQKRTPHSLFKFIDRIKGRRADAEKRVTGFETTDGNSMHNTNINATESVFHFSRKAQNQQQRQTKDETVSPPGYEIKCENQKAKLDENNTDVCEHDIAIQEGTDNKRRGADGGLRMSFPTVSYSKETANNQNNSAKRSIFKCSLQDKEVSSARCQVQQVADKGKAGSLNAESLSFGTNFNDMGNSSTKEDKALTSVSSALRPLPPNSTGLTKSLSEVHPDARVVEVLPQTASLEQHCLRNSWQGRRGRHHLNSAVNIVSSSMHHFTVQGRPSPVNDFQLYPPGWLNQTRFQLPSYPRAQEHQFQKAVRHPLCSRSRLSARMFQHQLPDLPEDDRLSHHPEEAEGELLNETRRNNQPSGQDSLKLLQQVGLGQIEYIEPGSSNGANNSEQSPKGRQRCSDRNNYSKAAIKDSSEHLPYYMLFEDLLKVSSSGHGKPNSLSSHSNASTTSWYCQALHPVRRTVPTTNEDRFKLSSSSDGRASLTDPSQPSWSNETHTCSFTRESHEHRGAFGSGDTDVETTAKQHRLQYEKGGSGCGQHLSHKALFLIGLIMHGCLCLPFAVTLAPGMWQGSDCLKRLHTLQVARLLLFCQVIACPLWLLAFPTQPISRRAGVKKDRPL